MASSTQGHTEPRDKACLGPGVASQWHTSAARVSAWHRCTIIGSDASAWMEPYHDRMPVLLQEADFEAWLDGSLGPEALKPAAESALRERTASPRLRLKIGGASRS
jgi:putative SOS response-associated peptidase YedK